MLPEELRRKLAQRTFSSPAEIWPEVRPKLDGRRKRLPAAILPVIVLLLIVLVAVFRGSPARPSAEGFGVTNVRSLGRPATSIVLRPDPKTLIVVVD